MAAGGAARGGITIFSDADEKLSGIETKMLDMFERAYDDWYDSGQPLPMSLVNLGEKTHKTILARLAKRGGFNINEMMRNPEQALVQLDKMKELILRMRSQEESMPNVFAFPKRNEPANA